MFRINRLNITKKIKAENLRLKNIKLLSNSAIDFYRAVDFVSKSDDYKLIDPSFDQIIPSVIYEVYLECSKINERLMLREGFWDKDHYLNEHEALHKFWKDKKNRLVSSK